MTAMTEADEREFWAQLRRDVREHLHDLGVEHGDVAEEPAFSFSPYVSVWAVAAKDAPGAPGWFAIAGDVPTDHVPAAEAPDARAALRHFARLWHEVADCMERGVPHATVEIGSPEEWPEIHPLLRTRASLLADFAEADELWADAADA